MANNYTELSAYLPIDADLLSAAFYTAQASSTMIEAREGYCGADWEMDTEGIWFHGEECDPEHVAEIAQAIIEELKMEVSFCFSWAYTCSKPRVNEFGGGACLLRRGFEPYWVDAMSVVREKAESEVLE